LGAVREIEERMVARTYLFVPGDRPEMLAKSERRGADAVIVDLEDAVAPSVKEAAREAMASWLTTPRQGGERWVRVNPGEALVDDVAAIAEAGAAPAVHIDGIMLPKVRSAVDVITAVGVLDRARLGEARVIVLIETARAVLAVAEIATAPRVHQMMIGEMDLGSELGIDPSSPAWLPIRLQLVVASAAAGIEAPLGPVDPDFADPERLRAETRALYDIGFRSRPAIHPAQVPVFNEALTPSPDEVAEAERLVGAFDAAVADGRGAFADVDGRMIDEAMVKVARATLESARRAGR
jgi:citrate lyase subunit beta/citryl-CoA lyase